MALIYKGKLDSRFTTDVKNEVGMVISKVNNLQFIERKINEAGEAKLEIVQIKDAELKLINLSENQDVSIPVIVSAFKSGGKEGNATLSYKVDYIALAKMNEKSQAGTKS